MATAEFRQVAIVGCGLIGGSIERAVHERLRATEIVPLDRGDDLRAVAGADLVILSAPVFENIRILSRLRAYLSPGALVTDTGSTKAATVEAAAGLRFIGGHPIAGAAASGRAAARADLFAGNAWILTPGSSADPADVAALGRFVERLGATVHLLDPLEHDRLFALVSHLPQLVVSALMHVVGAGAGAEGLALAGPGLHGTTRLASSPPAIWEDIVRSNHEQIAASLDSLIQVLQKLRDDRHGEYLRAVFESAEEWKERLDNAGSL